MWNWSVGNGGGGEVDCEVLHLQLNVKFIGIKKCEVYSDYWIEVRAFFSRRLKEKGVNEK